MVTWKSVETETLKKLYVENDVPSDRLIKSSKNLARFTGTFNQHLDNKSDFTEEQVADKLLKLRKSGKLPRLRS